MAPYRLLRFVFAAVVSAAGVLCAHAAFASQGPGAGPGTASSFTRLAMAIIVYGASALVVGAGLIGAAALALAGSPETAHMRHDHRAAGAEFLHVGRAAIANRVAAGKIPGIDAIGRG
ncbi:MAG: hypothetical protein QOF07_1805 [Bradyrhizobium sp.]|nr:hypothetical protein [Bradyrhizobium sp.]